MNETIGKLRAEFQQHLQSGHYLSDQAWTHFLYGKIHRMSTALRLLVEVGKKSNILIENIRREFGDVCLSPSDIDSTWEDYLIMLNNTAHKALVAALANEDVCALLENEGSAHNGGDDETE